jgi:DNA helicase II / ATP-dependent DNA helicase PcrA
MTAEANEPTTGIIGVVKMLKGTQEQELIWNEMEHGEDHMVIEAGAGTGKTFTIVEGSRLMDGEKAFLCFNKSIARELESRLPEDVYAATFHSMGLRAIKQQGWCKVDKSKTYKIVERVLGKDYFAVPLVKLIGLMKGSMVDAKDHRSIAQLIDKYNINFDSDRDEVIAFNNLPRIMELCKDMKTVDFDDMIWCPIVNNIPLQKYDVLFVDEAQDFNEAQRQLIYRSVEPNGRCIVVGDPNQAIYGFRGADSSSMNMFVDLLKTTNRDVSIFPLTLTWRCPVNVVKEANRYVSNFHCREDADLGSVKENASLTPEKDDIVLCRYNAPLATAFYSLLADGKSAYILGKDMTKGLVNYVNKVSRKKKRMTSREFLTLLDADFSKNYNRLVVAEKQNQANALEDKFNCVSIFATKADTVQGIIDEINRVFSSDGKGDIMLSTIHKAKGLEADNVFILATERMPHPKATNPQEERNICYVGITRAKKNLYYCGPAPRS